MAKVASAAPVSNKFSLGNNLALGSILGELIGSLALTLAVLNTNNSLFFVALVIVALVLILGKVSGGHINPLVTLGALVTRQISIRKALPYLIAQFLGAMLAIVIATKFAAGVVDPGTGMPAKLFSVAVSGDWKPFFAELLGALLIGFGAGSVFLSKKEGYEAAITIGGSFLIGVIIATSAATPSVVLNPAVALAAGALDLKNSWGLLAYALAPALGAALGALLYQLLQSDVRSTKRDMQ